MTCIAAKDGTIAADTQMTGGHIWRVQKIMKLPDGSVAGGAGNWAKCYKALSWLLAGSVGDPPKFKGAELLIIRPDGSIWCADDEFPEYPILDQFAAIGSGSTAAMVAMKAGKSAAEAVQAAVGLDAYTSAPVQVLSIGPKPRNRRK